MRLVLPTPPSPTRTQCTLRSGAEPERRRFMLSGKSRFFRCRGGTGGQSPAHTGSDTRRGFCFPISWGSMALPLHRRRSEVLWRFRFVGGFPFAPFSWTLFLLTGLLYCKSKTLNGTSEICVNHVRYLEQAVAQPSGFSAQQELLIGILPASAVVVSPIRGLQSWAPSEAAELSKWNQLSLPETFTVKYGFDFIPIYKKKKRNHLRRWSTMKLLCWINVNVDEIADIITYIATKDQYKCWLTVTVTSVHFCPPAA